jgi:quinol-cytochrome oxidoreductase complex cytochrome b subunit
LTRASHAGIALAGVLLVVLGASGAWLWWNYRPDQDEWIRVVHQVASVLLLVDAVALVVVAIVRRANLGARGILAAVGVLVTVGATYVTGRLLPWDQLALWAVVSRRDLPLGVAATFDDRVRFILLRSREVSASTYHWWAIAHLVLSALVLLAVVMVWLRARDRVVSRRSPAPEALPEPVSEA